MMPLNDHPVLLDCGTSYTKLLDLETGEYSIYPTREIKTNISSFNVQKATGHNASRFCNNNNITNELLALAQGTQHLLESEPGAAVVDCGSRDIKYITIDSTQRVSIDWNTECGAFCGQLIELLVTYFKFDVTAIRQANKPLAVPCGILGMTQMFDLIADDIDPEEAFARFMRGMADNIYRFCGSPEKIYLSGGLCDNLLFIKSFAYTKVVPLGRFVLLDGLKRSLPNDTSAEHLS